jgi:hypothetical protein
MARRYYDRYEEFRENGKVKILPFIRIPRKSTDQQVKYNGRTRLDIISDDYYNSPNFGWLIMQANPEFGGLEFNIPDGAIINVPFPLNESLQQYEREIKRYINLYGI